MTQSLLAFVVGSATRRAVLSRVADDPASSGALLAAVDASESAVYDAANRLEARGLIHRDDDVWVPTGKGHVLADAVRQSERLESLVADAPDYWERHDVSGLPERARETLSDLASYDVVQSPDTDPYRVERLTASYIAESDDVAIVTPIYHDRYAEALDEVAGDCRLVMSPEMVAGLLEDPPDDEGEAPATVRVHDASFALTVTDEALLLSLPRCDGTYDRDTELVATSDAARSWGDRVFDRVWSAATPVETYIQRELE